MRCRGRGIGHKCAGRLVTSLERTGRRSLMLQGRAGGQSSRTIGDLTDPDRLHDYIR
jgi:hypothetical protein